MAGSLGLPLPLVRTGWHCVRGACERACAEGAGQVIASRLLESKRTVPHLYASEAVHIDVLIELRTRLNGTASNCLRYAAACSLSACWTRLRSGDPHALGRDSPMLPPAFLLD